MSYFNRTALIHSITNQKNVDRFSLYGKSQSRFNSGYKFDYGYICHRRRLFTEERKKYYEYYRKIQYDNRRYIKKKKTNRLYRTTRQKVKVYLRILILPRNENFEKI